MNSVDVKKYFNEIQDELIVYVVEQRFVVGQGSEYFKSYRGKENFFDSDAQVKKRLAIIFSWIEKKIPKVAELASAVFNSSINTPLGISQVISSLVNLFSVHEHQAAGPEVIDPIIIQEGRIKQKTLSQLIALHKSSILRPSIIILLIDNDFERAKKLLSKCPHGTNIKFIRNSGESEIYKIINSGADDIEDFIDDYMHQCYSSCSRTKREILYNEEWAGNSLIKSYSPSIFKIRTNLLYDEKYSIRDDISFLESGISSQNITSSNETLLLCFLCISKLFKVYCYDYGGQDMTDALNYARQLDNEILLAHVYRYSFFLKQFNESERLSMLDVAENTFRKNNIYDHAIYCKNNRIIQQFYKSDINLREFSSLQSEAINNVPGLVGMSYIYNNVGVAYLLSSYPEKAIDIFSKGLPYAHDRIVQKLGLMSNLLIAKEYYMQDVPIKDITSLFRLIFDCNIVRDLPFIAANYVINSISISLRLYPGLYTELTKKYDINSLIKRALIPNQMGSGSLQTQMLFLKERYDEFSNVKIPSIKRVSNISGKRLDFILKYGYNPVIFHTWL